MKTKYIKVPVSEGVPDKEGDVYVKYKHRTDLYKYYFLDGFNDEECFNKHIDYWLEEVPDLEDEMVEMLQECRLQLEHLNSFTSKGTTNSVLSRLNTLLQKIDKL